jgi:Myb-like DNA-binding domain
MKQRLESAERTEKLSIFSKEKKKAKADKPSEEKNGWQSHEDDKLLQMVEKSSGLNWSRVARYMGGLRSAEECQLRYEDLSRRDGKKGNWSAEEDQLLRQWVVSFN